MSRRSRAGQRGPGRAMTTGQWQQGAGWARRQQDDGSRAMARQGDSRAADVGTQQQSDSRAGRRGAAAERGQGAEKLRHDVKGEMTPGRSSRARAGRGEAEMAAGRGQGAGRARAGRGRRGKGEMTSIRDTRYAIRDTR